LISSTLPSGPPARVAENSVSATRGKSDVAGRCFAARAQSFYLLQDFLSQDPIIGLTWFGKWLSFRVGAKADASPNGDALGSSYASLQNFEQNFQEEIPLKLKSLAVLTLLVLACSSAFAKPFSWGFMSYDGSVQYCDYETINLSSPYAAGVHNLTTACSLAVDGAMVGFVGVIPATTNAPVKRAVVMLADNTFDAEYQFFTGCQIDWVTKKKPIATWGWSFYFTCGGGGDYLGNYGYLSTTLGSPTGGSKKTSFGAVTARLKNKKQ
jgi:hypothetical protein